MAAHNPVNPPPMTVRSAVMLAPSGGVAGGASSRSDQNTTGFAWARACAAQPSAPTASLMWRGESVVAPQPSDAVWATAAKIFAYPVHRQRLPDRPIRISSSDGLGLRSSKARADMMMPGVQNPH